MRCQFSTRKPKEFGKEHKTIFSYIGLEPTFDLFILDEITERDFVESVNQLQEGPFLVHKERETIDYYHQDLAPDGKRLIADEIYMGLETNPTVVESKEWDWNDLRFDSIPEKFMHACFLAYHPNANHGRIGGPVLVKRIKQVDEQGKEISTPLLNESNRAAFLERQGCFKESQGCVKRMYGFNLRIKNWVNSIFGGIFGRNLVGNEPNGCLPSLLPSGCTGAGCQRFGCGFLSLLLAFGFILWLLRCFLFGACGDENSNPQVVERIVHDTIYIEKNSKVDTVTYADETTNTTVKMLSLPNVQFEKNKAILLKSSIPQLNELAAYLIENKEINAEIIGHTDADGDAEANRKLSQDRAEEVRQYLIQNGVEAQRVKATGKGESEPVADNKTAEGRAMNRRVEVKLSQSNSSKTTRTKKNNKKK
jgi:outer membrane protein OmpA-like peptidoglycan-associated protein